MTNWSSVLRHSSFVIDSSFWFRYSSLDLRHALQILISHNPPVLRKPRRVSVGRSIPPSRHHRDGSEESAVAGEIKRQVVALVIVAVWQVETLRRLDQQRINGEVRPAHPRCAHCRHRKIPAPAAVPLPHLHYLLQRALHGREIDPVARHHAQW